MSTSYVNACMEAYDLPDDAPETFHLALCTQCALALAGYSSANTGTPETDEAAELMEAEWGHPYAAQLTDEPAEVAFTATCDGCGTGEPGPRHSAIAHRIA